MTATEPTNKAVCINLGGFTDYYRASGQTEPPTIPVSKLYEIKPFPVGEIQEYIQDFNRSRISNEEKMHLDGTIADTGFYETVREAAEVHRQVRHYAQSYIKPGIKIIDMCEKVRFKAGAKRQVVLYADIPLPRFARNSLLLAMLFAA